MGKSIKIGKFLKLNFSLSGLSLSGGVKGARLNLSPRGLKTTVTVPGTGLSKSKTLVSFKKRKKKNKKAENNQSTAKENHLSKSENESLSLDLEARNTGLWFAIAILLIGIVSTLLLSNYRIYTVIVLIIGLGLVALSLVWKKTKSSRAFNKGVTAYEDEEFDEAIQYFKKAYDINQKDDSILLIIATLLYLYGESYGQAMDYFDKLKLEDMDSDMKNAYADSCLEVGEYNKSLKILESYKLEGLEDMDRTTLMAQNHLGLGRLDLAKEILKTSIGRKTKMTEDVIEANYWLGITLEQLGELDQAKKILTKVYLADSDFEDIQEIMTLLEENR